jgi:hypothetical protein
LILYVNGDSHSAGAEAVNSFAFACDDPKYKHLKRTPHPDNLVASYGQLVADSLDYQLVCDAESASSNDRILRTTQDYLKTNTPDLLIIGWTTWEREEWLIDGVYYQVNASGVDYVPDSHKQQYIDWVLSVTPEQRDQYWHDTIHQLHQDLTVKKIPHLFFNTYTSFSHIAGAHVEWNDCYIDPYSDASTYFYWLKSQGLSTVTPSSYHYGADAHLIWAKHLTKLINESIITT